MSDMQMLRKIGACENKQAQSGWTGPELTGCTAPSAFLCEICGWMLCGGHASGHQHAAGSDKAALASHFQQQATAAAEAQAAAAANAATVGEQLKQAQVAQATLAQIKGLVG